MATIENVNDRTILQQFHSLYKAVEEIKNKGINLNVKGQYESTTTYLQGDVVYNNGKAFYRINDSTTTGIDTTNTEYWQMFFDAVTGLTGPQGPQGPQGPKGENGVGFNDATIIKVINDAITVDNTGINLEQTTEVTTQSNGTFEINTQSKLPIAGSDTVVVDLAEDGTHANIHLDADIKNKLDKALVTPTSTPTATEIVAVDNTNSQTMLAIGDGLSVENGTLKASGGSSEKLYQHNIIMYNSSSMQAIIKISIKSSDLINSISDLTQKIYDNYASKPIQCNIFYPNMSTALDGVINRYVNALFINSNDAGTKYFAGYGHDYKISDATITLRNGTAMSFIENVTIKDTVTEL